MTINTPVGVMTGSAGTSVTQVGRARKGFLVRSQKLIVLPVQLSKNKAIEKKSAKPQICYFPRSWKVLPRPLARNVRDGIGSWFLRDIERPPLLICQYHCFTLCLMRKEDLWMWVGWTDFWVWTQDDERRPAWRHCSRHAHRNFAERFSSWRTLSVDADDRSALSEKWHRLMWWSLFTAQADPDLLPRRRHRASRMWPHCGRSEFTHCKNSSCSIIQLFSRPKVSKSRCMISQEPFLQRGWTLTAACRWYRAVNKHKGIVTQKTF